MAGVAPAALPAFVPVTVEPEDAGPPADAGRAAGIITIELGNDLVLRVPGDGLVDDSGVRGHDAGGQGHVTFGYPAVFYLIGEFLVGVVVLGDHHQSRSIFVQPVDDARPDFAANPLNVGASSQ